MIFQNCLCHHMTVSSFMNKNNEARLHVVPMFSTESRMNLIVQFASKVQHSTASDIYVSWAALSTPHWGLEVWGLEWLGHAVRTNDTRTVTRSLEGTPGRCGGGLPIRRWIYYVGSDLKNMGIKIWRIRGLDRTKWEPVNSEAKAKLKGSYC